MTKLPKAVMVGLAAVAVPAVAFLVSRPRQESRTPAGPSKVSVPAPAGAPVPGKAEPPVPAEVAAASSPFPVAPAVPAAGEKTVPPLSPFPVPGGPPAKQPVSPSVEVPVEARKLRARLRVKDPMAANSRFLRLLAEVPAQLVNPPAPIWYDLLLQPDVAEIFLSRLKEIGPFEVEQESAGASGAPTRLTVEILSLN